MKGSTGVDTCHRGASCREADVKTGDGWKQLDLWIRRGAWQPQVEALFGDKRCMVTSGGGIIWG